MDKNSRLNRQGSRLRRQEWQDYSSSENEELDPQKEYCYREDHTHQYEDPRNVGDPRKQVADRGRGQGSSSGTGSSGRSYSTHSSLELLTGRNYSGVSGSEGEMERENRYGQGTGKGNNVVPMAQPLQYPAYASLPRKGSRSVAGSVREQQQPTTHVDPVMNPPETANPIGRLSFSLRRGASSSSTSDNNSDATYTDSEPMTRRRGRLEGKNVFRDSPPEPAPPVIPPRSIPSVHHVEALGMRPRLGYLESECESEPPYLPTMLPSGLSAYTSQELGPNQALSVIESSTTLNASSDKDEIKSSPARGNNKSENERIYTQPQNQLRTDLLCNNVPVTAVPSGGTNNVPTSSSGPTYSNPLPVFCGTPNSTTGPMVPVTNCVNPQLIQASTSHNAKRPPFSATSAFTSANISSSRFNFRKSCSHRCSWKMATIVLILVTIVLTATMAYFAATSILMVSPESNKPCIVVDDGERSQSMANFITPASKGNTGYYPSPCLSIPSDAAYYSKIGLDSSLSKRLDSRHSWTVWFNQTRATWVRFNLTAPRSAKLALFARRNFPPSLTMYDLFEIVNPEQTRSYRRSAVQLEEVNFLHYLEPGPWYISIINDDQKEATTVAFHPSVANDVPTTCPNNCNRNGNCQLGKCHCFPGYIGHDCADNVCPVLCNNHGRYVHGTCRCDKGWKGAECNVPAGECEVPDCNRRGKCIDGVCTCEPGHKGQYCEDVDCEDPTCSNHGVCVKGQCWCKIGWRGVNCSEADDRLSRCFPDCSAHGVYDLDSETCMCFEHWTGADCSKATCNLDCGPHGRCEEGRCQCEQGWTGLHCEERTCDQRCLDHGQCNNGTCICIQGWMGRHCSLDGCPKSCHSHGHCVRQEDTWLCQCDLGWGGKDCGVPQEINCRDEIDNDGDGLTDCADSECCNHDGCKDNVLCMSSPDPLDILLRKQPPAVTASFYQKMKFLIDEDSVQNYPHRDEFSESRVSVIRGRVVSKQGDGLTGVRVGVAAGHHFGFTLTRRDGWFDILVNGGGAVTLEFQRSHFHPIKRTIMVPWNDIVVMETVVMSVTLEDNSSGGSQNQQDPCLAHDYDVMKPIVYQTWRPGSQGGCTEKSVLVAETQVLQETVNIPGSDLHLVYHSSHAQGYLSTIHLQLTPSKVPETLQLVILRIVVEGILFEKTFEADPHIKYTYAWNKRNIYKQKVFGLTTARVFVGYKYHTCQEVVWTAQAITIRGYDMDVSELGGWNLDIHHRYNFHEGVLQKGDGSTIYFRQQPRVISVLMGTGQQRPLLCPECNGMARENKLLAPVALTSGPDGSVYVGDFNLVRRINPLGQVYTLLRMRTTEVSYEYHLTLSPTDGHLYISDAERHQILRVRSLDKVEDADSNFEAVVGSGKRCLPGDKHNCGDEGPAIEARLSYPKGMAVAVDSTLYFADGPNIRMVDNRGIIHTLIGDHHHKRRWRPIPCSGTLSMEEVQLRWPTELAINPLDGALYFIDDHMVLKLTKDKRVMVVAGKPVYCKTNTHQNLKSRMTTETTLGSLISFAFGPNGVMYIAEGVNHNAHRIRIVTPDGEILHFAGKDKACSCAWQNCTCEFKENSLAMETRLFAVSSLTVTSDNVVHIADQGSLRILTAVPYLPQPSDKLEFNIAYPDNHEIYVFNKYGQHIKTKSILTGKTKYTFLYNVNTSYGKLTAVTDASGNKVAFLRDSGNSLHTIETARGLKCSVQVTKKGLLEILVDPDRLQTYFDYDSTGLLTSRSDGAGRTFFYVYDENGRLSRVIKPSGRMTFLEFDLGPEGASVKSEDSDGTNHVMVTVKGQKVINKLGGAPFQATLHQDRSIEVETPWDQGVIWKTSPHQALQEILPIQAGMFPIPVKQITFWGIEPSNTLEWHYDIKYDRNDRVESQNPVTAVTAVKRILLVNGVHFFTVEYDWEAGREIVYNSSRRPFLMVQYDSSSRPIKWLPTDTRRALLVSYDRLGRLSGWRQDPLEEKFEYDRMGHLSEITYANNNVLRYTYDGQTRPEKVILPSGRTFIYRYDQNGGLKEIITPKESLHTFLAHASIGFYKLYYTPPGNNGKFVTHFNDFQLPVLVIYPGDKGRVAYRYNNQSLLTAIIFGGGKIEKNYTVSGFVESEAWSNGYVEVKNEYVYEGALLLQCRYAYRSNFSLNSTVFYYEYDNHFRVKRISARINNLQIPTVDFAFSSITGSFKQIGGFKIFEANGNKTIISDDLTSFTREVDALHRMRHMSLLVMGKEVYKVVLHYNDRDLVSQAEYFIKQSEDPSKTNILNYSYDSDGQLKEVKSDEEWRFAYDSNGNLITINYNRNRIDILHDTEDRIVSFGETSYVVDGRGFVIERGEEHFSYNTKGQLLSVHRLLRYHVDYYYDARGRLAARKDSLGNVTQFFYTDIQRLHLPTYVYNNNDGRIISILYDDRNLPIYVALNDEKFYVATDHNGSPLAVFDSKGEIIKKIIRGPYGSVLIDNNPTFYLPVDFQGGIRDSLTGLIHFGDRIYDPFAATWMTPDWDGVIQKARDPLSLNLYTFNKNDPINMPRSLPSKLDLKGWIKHQGINLDHLGLAAANVFASVYQSPLPKLNLDIPSVSLVSGYICSISKKLESFAMLSNVEKSKVKREQLFESVSPKFSMESVPFGKGIILSRVNGKAIVRSVKEADSIRRNVFTSVFNGSYLLDLHLFMHSMDVFYFVKDSTWRVSEDLNQLQRLGTSINTTVYDGKTEGGKGTHADIRIHTQHAIINIRYGTTPSKERRRLLRHAKKHAVGQRWAHERDMIMLNQEGAQRWTEKEKEHIVNSGSVPGYRGDYFHDVEMYPELADDPSNIVFHESKEKSTR
ncbi:teneurin-a-like isoform X3 [Tachypleus tridentatus]|uniref:teneurin-a-like isoform X3 n=1 Tax=Tachypleus tridentatus TaxID=6853 RepID=UPI003FD498EF